MMDLWIHLEERFLVRLHHSYTGVVQHLEVSLQRFFLVNAVQCEKVKHTTHVALAWRQSRSKRR